MRYLFTTVAREELADIVDYIAGDKPGAAERVADAAIRTFETLAEFPELGRLVDIVNDQRIYVLPLHQYSNYLVFYNHPAKGSVQILRVIDGRRDLSALF